MYRVLYCMIRCAVEHHGASGLTEASRNSTTTEKEAEDRIFQFVRKYVSEPRKAHLAGNSIYVDVGFLRKWMPRLLNYFHYRLIDVSTISELAKRWYRREVNKMPKKKNAHTAMNDIKDSIAQLRFYKKTIFK